jgi:putative flippase GtrA
VTSGRVGSLNRLWRYYQAGILNTLFGYSAFAILIKLGLWMYAAQLIAHVLGVIFNYLTYSNHAFADQNASKSRFALAYALNYLLGLTSLFVAAQLINSPYIAGLVSILVVSLINYLVLKKLVFKPTTGPKRAG